MTCKTRDWESNLLTGISQILAKNPMQSTEMHLVAFTPKFFVQTVVNHLIFSKIQMSTIARGYGYWRYKTRVVER